MKIDRRVSCGTKDLTLFNAPIPDAIFLHKFSTWTFQDRVWSIWTPRDFVEVTWVIGAPSIISDGGLWNVLSLYLDPININSVLDALRVSLLAVNHFSTLAISTFKTVLIFSMLLLAKDMCVSSAYIRGSAFDRQLGKSLIYIIKRSGPRIVPWGIPQVRKWSLEREPFIKHRCLRRFKYDLNQVWSDQSGGD